MIAATAYVFAPYFLSALYVRHALADYSAFAFMPPALWALYRFCTAGKHRFLVIGATSTALVILSSLSVAVMILPALGLMTLWQAWQGRSGRVLARGAACIILGVGLSAFFLAPALGETAFVHLARRGGRLDFQDHFLNASQLVSTFWGYGLSVKGPDDGMGFGLGPVHLILVGAAFLVAVRTRRRRPDVFKIVAFFSILLGASLFLTLGASRFVWQALTFLGPLQFPWRFLSLATVCTAFLCGAVIGQVGPEGRRGNATRVAIAAFGLLYLGVVHARPWGAFETRDADFSPQVIATRGIPATAREFEPIWVSQFPSGPAIQPLTFVTGEGLLVNSRLRPTVREFTLDVRMAGTVRINTFYFPGWTVVLDGVTQPVDHGNPQGLMELEVPAGRHVLRVVFKDTPIRVGASLVSLATLAGLLGWPLAKKVARPAGPSKRQSSLHTYRPGP